MSPPNKLDQIWLSVGILLLALSTGFGTSVPKPSLHYTITNQTSQRIITFIQIESDDPAFSKTDTVNRVAANEQNQSGPVAIQSPHSTLKAYQRLIIQTDQRYYQTPTLLVDDRCKAFSVQITQTGLTVQTDYSLIIRRWVIQLLIVSVHTVLIKGVPLLLLAAPYVKRVYLPFLTINALFMVAILTLLNVSFGRPVQAGPMEIKFFKYTLLAISLLEAIWYYQLSPERGSRIRLMMGILAGSLLWVFPGFLITVFALFLVAHC